MASPPGPGVLLPDMLFDVLLRLPAPELCRIRAVCRSWRSLTSDPLFVAAHAARHPPLFLANFLDGPTPHIHVLDLSGNVLKRIPNIPYGHQLLPTRLDLACTATFSNGCRVIDPATATVHVLPECPAPPPPPPPPPLPPAKQGNPQGRLHQACAYYFAFEGLLHQACTYFAFGRIAATGEYKVLRMWIWPILSGIKHQLFEVFTITSGSCSGSSHAGWRASRSPDESVEPSSAVVVGDMVYFKVAGANHGSGGIDPDSIISFDLETEEWRGTIQGPISSIFFTDEYDDHSEDDYRDLWSQLTLADLRDRLVLVHCRNCRHVMDLWFLEGFDNALWVKEYSIQTEPIFPTAHWRVKALFMLDDGRLVIHLAATGLLFVYDPRTNTSARVNMRPLSIAMYTGSLLSLQVGDRHGLVL